MIQSHQLGVFVRAESIHTQVELATDSALVPVKVFLPHPKALHTVVLDAFVGQEIRTVGYDQHLLMKQIEQIRVHNSVSRCGDFNFRHTHTRTLTHIYNTTHIFINL